MYVFLRSFPEWVSSNFCLPSEFVLYSGFAFRCSRFEYLLSFELLPRFNFCVIAFSLLQGATSEDCSTSCLAVRLCLVAVCSPLSLWACVRFTPLLDVRVCRLPCLRVFAHMWAFALCSVLFAHFWAVRCAFGILLISDRLGFIGRLRSECGCIAKPWMRGRTPNLYALRPAGAYRPMGVTPFPLSRGTDLMFRVSDSLDGVLSLFSLKSCLLGSLRRTPVQPFVKEKAGPGTFLKKRALHPCKSKDIFFGCTPSIFVLNLCRRLNKYPFRLFP